MIDAKSLRVVPINSRQANKFVCAFHYSGKVTQNAQLHFGVTFDGKLHGVMQFGPSIDKRRMMLTVKDTPFNGFLELNRITFDEILPCNSESRCLSVALRLIRKHYPHIQWVVTFADATQCGDGTIYRASGFQLIGIKKNTSMVMLDGSTVVAKKTLDNTRAANGRYLSSVLKDAGRIRALDGFQIKYIYFLDSTARERLTVPIIPFSRIAEMGASMYRGGKITARPKQDTATTSGMSAGQNRPGRSNSFRVA